jgi:uncharacterized protein Usg
MAASDFRRQLEGYGLTTAQILYRLPDHPALLQTYVWQDYDLCPKFPVLNRFLAFWLEKLEGPLHSVTVAHSRLIRPAEIRAVNGVFRLHYATCQNVLGVTRPRPPMADGGSNSGYPRGARTVPRAGEGG